MYRTAWMLSGCIFAAFFSTRARSEFVVSNAVLEFNSSTPPQQDIRLISRSTRADEKDYITSEISYIRNPGTPQEQRVPVTNPTQSHLLVTPEKSILGANSEQVQRFVLLQPLDSREHIYRVAFKPVISGLESDSQIGLKILVGYEVLVIIRPDKITHRFHASRDGKTLRVENHGNSNLLFQNGKQCDSAGKCLYPPITRIYAGQTATIPLPMNDSSVTYMIWDGQKTFSRTFP